MQLWFLGAVGASTRVVSETAYMIDMIGSIRGCGSRLGIFCCTIHGIGKIVPS